jgi:8-oxo-dGTP pyrophosphatase MutT (NUDIX family)
MLQRVGRGAFAGMWVFPGGKVDPEDRVVISDIELASELATARIAAAREAQEETGLSVEPFAMAPLSHWMPPPSETRRFSTWFFVAPAPSGDIELSVDEATAHRWITPEDALAANAQGDLPLAPPTWMTLQHLSGSSSVDDLTGALRRREPLRMHTRVVNREPLTLAWAGDVSYEHADDAIDPSADGPRHRLVMHRAGWEFQRG